MSGSESYISNRTELWERPSREDYVIPYTLQLAMMDNPAIDLPMTRKQFDIMLHTIKNIREKGKQFEILLKVKQADNNPMFDFLNDDSNLFELYQYLKIVQEEDFWSIFLRKDESSLKITGNALSLINSYSDSDQDDEGNNDRHTAMDKTIEELLDMGNIENLDDKMASNHGKNDEMSLERKAEKQRDRLKRIKLLLGKKPVDDSPENGKDISQEKKSGPEPAEPVDPEIARDLARDHRPGNDISAMNSEDRASRPIAETIADDTAQIGPKKRRKRRFDE